MTGASSPTGLGCAGLPPQVLTALVSDSLGRLVELGDAWTVQDIGFTPTALSTAAVLRVAGTAHAGATRLPWSVLVKSCSRPGTRPRST